MRFPIPRLQITKRFLSVAIVAFLCIEPAALRGIVPEIPICRPATPSALSEWEDAGLDGTFAAGWFFPLVRAEGRSNFEFFESLQKIADPRQELTRLTCLDELIQPPSASIPIVLTVFEDLNCAHCRTLSVWLDELVADFSPTVVLEHRQFPLAGPGSSSFEKAKLSICLGTGERAKKARRELYEIEIVAPGEFDIFWTSLGGDASELRQCSTSAGTLFRVLRHVESGMRSGVIGTPFLFLNGRKLRGPTSKQGLASELCKALHEAKQVLPLCSQ